MSTSEPERALLKLLSFAGIVQPVPEYRFHPTRRWRFDFAWPDKLIAVEVEGIGGPRSRHLSWRGFQEDTEKYNAAAIMGWCVLRVTSWQIEDGKAVEWVEEAFRSREYQDGGG